MSTYLIAHYNGITPAFSQAETLDEARASALTLLNSRYCKSDDVLSIVNAANDCVVYYGKRDELIAKLNVAAKPKTSVQTSWAFSFKQLLSWVGLKVAGPSVG